MQAHYFFAEEVTSTQDVAREALPRLSPDEISVFVAQRQTAGRGRGGRTWVSSQGGNLYVTLVAFIPPDISIAPFSLVVAAVMSDVLKEWNFSVKVKWPNDLILEGKKIGGILCEVVSHGNQKAFLCGVGLNVNMSLEAFDRIDRPATSLLIEGHRSYPTQTILKHFVERWSQALSAYFQDGFAPFLTHISTLLSHQPGDRLRFHRGSEIVEGTFLALTEEGGCTIALPTGEKRTILSGEIIHSS